MLQNVTFVSIRIFISMPKTGKCPSRGNIAIFDDAFTRFVELLNGENHAGIGAVGDDPDSAMIYTLRNPGRR